MKRTGFYVHVRDLAKIKKLWGDGKEMIARMEIRKAAHPYGVRTGKIDIDLKTGEIIQS